MTKITFRERLQQNKPILSDGAMGTMLSDNSIVPTSCFEALNISQPYVVQAVHRAYIEAGAELIETNTFGANVYKLGNCEMAAEVIDINCAGVAIAKQVAAEFPDRQIYVAGSVGPLGVRLRPYGRVRVRDALAAFRQQVEALLSCGIDALILETFSDHNELLLAVEASREIAPEIPLIAQMRFSGDDRTLLGFRASQITKKLQEAGVDVIGINCSGGPSQNLRILKQIRAAAPDYPLSIMPNAGFPELINERMMYPASADYFADYATRAVGLGARIVGGCCGTTADHIAAMQDALVKTPAPATVMGNGASITIQSPDDEHELTGLARKLKDGKFVITVEMSPHRSFNTHQATNSARLLMDAGADTIDVADNPTARMCMSPWALCHILQMELEIESILHFPTRGRNILRIQSDLLASYALGLRNLFITMGDPTRIGDYPEAMDDYDIVPSGLIRLISQQMNTGVDQAGHSIGEPTSFTVGCALNMGAKDIDREIRVLTKKLDAGADFALSQTVFDPRAVETFQARYREVTGKVFDLPVLIGIIPLYSIRNALFLHNEIPGINIPQPLLKRMENAEDPPAEGVRIAAEIVSSLKGLGQGVYIIPPFYKYDLAAELIDKIL
jgi:methionine synthase / methylenetetrahydrofolate reductase(NADPH)